MLAVTSYSPEHVARCKRLIAAQLAAYSGISSNPTFDHEFFKNLVLTLDRCFVHRMRGAEGKDGNALNEIRMISDSIVNNDGILTADKSIKYQAEKSVTRLEIGDAITLGHETFQNLANAVFIEIERRFS